jgi:hypothetical protein
LLVFILGNFITLRNNTILGMFLGMLNKRYLVAWFLVTAVIFGLLVASLPFAMGQSGTNVVGIISTDTIWTKADGPYSLTGPTAVNSGVTLTIEPGVVVNLGYYYLQVNGTLIAKGTSTDWIQFNGGSTRGIMFTSVSNKWNEAAGSGCIIQYATIQPCVASEGSVKIDHCTVLGDLIVGGSSIVTNNNLKSGASVFDSTLLSNNIISGRTNIGPVSTVPIVFATVDVTSSGVLTIADNIINGDDSKSGGIGISCYRYIRVINNTINACQEAIRLRSSETSGYPLVEKNVIYGNQMGIVIHAGLSTPVKDSPLIEGNLIANNQLGISVENYGGIATPTIQNNNIYSNNHNLHWSLTNNIEVTNNWWGTTDAQAINQTIVDVKHDFNWGKVTFTPFLTAPNPDAPTLQVTPSSAPSPTPTVPEFPATPTLTIILMATITAGILYKTNKNPADLKVK